MLASIYPASHITTDFNLEGFFPPDSPTIKAYQDMAAEFGRDDNVIIVAYKDEDMLTTNGWATLAQLTQDLGNLPYVTNISSLYNLERIVNEQDNLIIKQYSSDSGIPKLSDLLSNPFVRQLFISNDGSTTALYIEIDQEQSPFLIRSVVIEELELKLKNYPHIDFKIAGIPYFRNQYVYMLNREILMYISISTVLIILLLWFLFRNVMGVLIPMIIVWLTILFTVTFMVLTGGFFEVLSSTIAPILLCVGVADSIHLLSKYNDARLHGLARKSALKETLLVLGYATLLTSVTTAIGFATLVTSSVIPMKRFGLYTASGVILAFIITIFVLPSIIPFFKDKKSKFKSAAVHQFLQQLLELIFGFSQKYHRVIVVFTLLVTLLFGYGISKLKVNGTIFDDVGTQTTVMKHARFVSENLTPPFPLEFIIDTKTENGITTVDFQRRLQLFHDFLLSYDEVHNVTSIHTILQETHDVMQGRNRVYPESDQQIAQYVLLLELSDDTLLETVTDFNYSKIRVAAMIEDAGSFRINQLRDDFKHWLTIHFPNETVTTTGTSILVADLTNNMVQSLFSSIGLAVVFIGVIMAFLFKNSRLLFISLMPNIIPLIIIAGIMGYVGIDIKPSTAVIFTIAFGIAVDDSIHFLARLKIEIEKRASLQEALKITAIKTGQAILLTSVILIAGFGSLATSSFTSTMLMGILTCTTVVLALIADILFLPALIHWIKPDINRS